ncbi:MAG: coproporphyrinogen III oxidase, partial [Dokdonella sp.]
IDLRATSTRHDIVFESYFAGSLQHLAPLLDDGLLTSSPTRITIAPRGRLLLRNVAMCFDAYLPEIDENAQRHSKAR